MRDHASNISIISSIVPAVQAATIKGTAVDLRDAGGATFIVHTGAIASAGDFTAKLQESDTTEDTDFADAVNLVGAFPSSLTASATFKVGYVGYKRYARVVLTKNGGTSIAAGAVAELAALRQRPAA